MTTYLVQSLISNGKTFQWYWEIGKKRVYVKQSLKPTYAAEVERGRRVKELPSKIEMLRNVF